MRLDLPLKIFAAVCLTIIFSTLRAVAGPFIEPPVIASAHGLLDLLIIAKPKPVESILFAPPAGQAVHPTGWVYEICQRAKARGNKCPKNPTTLSDYGGIRLALGKGDLLKFRLVNKLPKLDPVKVTHSTHPGGANLPLNPTNFHTHGLVVPAREASPQNPTWGDNIFVDIFNPENGRPKPQQHQHSIAVSKGHLDYQIAIPLNEPSGADWVHPHVHGLAADQVSSGLAGLLSIGRAGDYAFFGDKSAPFPEEQVRHLILKDMQVLAGGRIQFSNGWATVSNGEVLNDEQDPAFCSQYPSSAADLRLGSCPGVNNTASGGNNYTGGRWYFLISGQQFPTLRITEAQGQIWRLTHASASASYDFQLVDDASHKPMLMQLLSVDGVSVHIPQGTPPNAVVILGGARFKVVDCPLDAPPRFGSAPVCVSEFIMMPSSRAELWVTYRDANGRVATPPSGASATFKTLGITTGAPGVGDPWPAIDLARVEFAQPATPHPIEALAVVGDALAANRGTGIFSAPVPYAHSAPPPDGCKALPPGHRRRVFFGLVDPLNNPNVFGLGYEEVDQKGAIVPGTQRPVSAFNPSLDSVCLPLGPGQTPVHETWELVNLATEKHNFHIHQTKFRLVQPGAPTGSPLSEMLNQAVGAGVMEDNVPLPVAIAKTAEVAAKQNGYCTISQWRSGQCDSKPVILDIPFSQLGQFVYHCHILEHEDGGMMAKIQVVPAPE